MEIDLAQETIEKGKSCHPIIAFKSVINPSGNLLIVRFLVHLERGQTDSGNLSTIIKAVETLDLIGQLKDSRLLVHAAESAYNKGDKVIVKHVLKLFAVSDIQWDSPENQLKLFVIFRCLIRLNEVDISESKTKERKVELIDESLRYISKILQLSSKWFAKTSENTQKLEKEIEWLIQSCWNQAVEAENCNLELSACLLFEQTGHLIKLNNSPLYLETLYICYYFSIKLRINLSRQNKDLLAQNLSIAKGFFNALSDLIPLLSDKLEQGTLRDLKSFLILSNFEMELLNENWDNLSKIIDSPDVSTYPVSLLKSMAGAYRRHLFVDKVTLDHETPSGIMYLTIKATMNGIMKQETDFDLIKFAQWFRLLIQTSAISNQSVTIDHLNQALKLIKSFPKDYPLDEINWLMINSWNIGMRLSNIENDLSVPFFETALKLSQSLPSDMVPSEIKTWSSHNLHLE
jgi:hypothetical protein